MDSPVDKPDLRPLAEIQFAIDSAPEDREAIAARVREILAPVCKTAADVIDLGCTGLVLHLVKLYQSNQLVPDSAETRVLQDTAGRVSAAFVREHIGGAGFAFPCYVPPEKFCLVHHTIGGLQLRPRRQAIHYPEGIPLVSRDLTPDERKHALAIGALLDQAAESEAEKFNMTDKRPPEAAHEPEPETAPSRAIGEKFVCPEHRGAPEWRCRFCVAAVIIAGPFLPRVRLDVYASTAELPTRRLPQELDRYLTDEGSVRAELLVELGAWKRGLIPVKD